MSKTALNVQQIYQQLGDNVAFTVQYDGDLGPACAPGATVAKPNIVDVCDIMTAANGTTKDLTDMQRYATAYAHVANCLNGGPQQNNCFEFEYAGHVADLKQSGWSSDSVQSGSRQWLWQTCTEFGNFQTSSWAPGDIFGFYSEDFFARQCTDVLGAT